MEKVIDELSKESKAKYGEPPHILTFNMQQLLFVVFMRNLISWYQNIAIKMKAKLKAKTEAYNVEVDLELDPA